MCLPHRNTRTLACGKKPGACRGLAGGFGCPDLGRRRREFSGSQRGAAQSDDRARWRRQRLPPDARPAHQAYFPRLSAITPAYIVWAISAAWAAALPELAGLIEGDGCAVRRWALRGGAKWRRWSRPGDPPKSVPHVRTFFWIGEPGIRPRAGLVIGRP
jgi:hypothetical protein